MRKTALLAVAFLFIAFCASAQARFSAYVNVYSGLAIVNNNEQYEIPGKEAGLKYSSAFYAPIGLRLSAGLVHWQLLFTKEWPIQSPTYYFYDRVEPEKQRVQEIHKYDFTLFGIRYSSTKKPTRLGTFNLHMSYGWANFTKTTNVMPSGVFYDQTGVTKYMVLRPGMGFSIHLLKALFITLDATATVELKENAFNQIGFQSGLSYTFAQKGSR